MSDIINSRKLQQEINRRLDILEKKTADRLALGAYRELEDIKQWVIDNQAANGADKSTDLALHKHFVSNNEVTVSCRTCKYVNSDYDYKCADCGDLESWEARTDC